MKPFVFLIALVCLLSVGPGSSAADVPVLARPTGNAEHGRQRYLAFRCYACHGYGGQTGVKRLVPMEWPQEAFIGYVRHVPNPEMPSYSAVSDADLADIYAFLRSVKLDAPPIEKVPLLRELQRQHRGGNEL